jgi:hypothetical protein
MHLIQILTFTIFVFTISSKAGEYRFNREEGGMGLMDVIGDSKGNGISIQFDNDSDPESMAVWGALMEAEINGTQAPCKYNGMFFDQAIVLKGEFTSEVLHTKAVENGVGSEPYRIFKVKSIEIGFPFSRLKYPNDSRAPEKTVLETHFGFDTLFPRGIKLDGKKIDLSKFRKEPPHDLSNSIMSEPNGEQVGAGQPATRPESKSEGSDKPQPEPDRRSR